MLKENWDRELRGKLRDLGLTNPDQIGSIVGLVAEHRMTAYKEGYDKSYTDHHTPKYKDNAPDKQEWITLFRNHYNCSLISAVKKYDELFKL